MGYIKSITEAFSMQPITRTICCAERDYSAFGDIKGTPHVHHQNCIKEIVLDTRRVNTDKQVNFYVGIDFQNAIRFEHPQESVSVEYLTPPAAENDK